jgi:hypothetical protein
MVGFFASEVIPEVDNASWSLYVEEFESAAGFQGTPIIVTSVRVSRGDAVRFIFLLRR